MIERVLRTIRNYLKKRTIIVAIVILIVWGVLFFGLVYFKVPVTLYIDHSESPWQPISAKTYPETGVTAIEFVDSSHGWIAGENGMIKVTTDGGKSWEDQPSKIDTDIRAIDFFNANIGVAISKEYDILITRNSGNTWILLEKPQYPITSGWISPKLWDVVTCDEQTAWVLGGMGIIFRIDIPNQNWTFVSDVSLSLGYLAMVNSSHGWATGGFGAIVRTTDGWQSYEIQDAGVSQNFFGIFFWDAHKGWVVGSDNTILATIDGGQHWGIQYTHRPFLADYGSVALLDIFFVTKSKGWAVGSYGIHYTKDGGNNWYNLGSKTWSPSRITFANETHGWAVGYRKERSYITTVGGVPPIDENLLNLGVGICILIGICALVLTVSILRRPQTIQNELEN